MDVEVVNIELRIFLYLREMGTPWKVIVNLSGRMNRSWRKRDSGKELFVP